MSGTYLGQIGFDAARCAAIALLALGLGWPVGARLGAGRWKASLLLAPILTPALLVSYAYQPLALRLTGQPVALVLMYSALLVFKLSALAALARWLFPPAVSREALYCARLAQGLSVGVRLRFALGALGPLPWAILVLSFLLAFTDFELASLLSVKNWAVVLFDAHAGGLEIHESLRRVVVPLAIEVLLVATLILSLRRAPATDKTLNPAQSARWAVILAGIVAAITAAVPLGFVIVQAARALPTIVYTGVMLQEIVTSIGFAVAGAGLAWIVAGAARSSRFGTVLAIPGLLGGLVLALMIIALFQTRLLRVAYDTPAPLALGLAMLLTPVAMLVSWIVRVHRPRESLHLARMAGSRRLIWELALSRKLAAIGLVFLLAYFELTASSLLTPVGFTPAFVRLHNLAHYGQTPILSLMLLAATLAPAVLLALTLGLGRLYARRDAR
jgi:hypothetical protein